MIIMRKGAIHLDYIIGFMLLLTAIAICMYYVNVLNRPQAPFGDAAALVAFDIRSKLLELCGTTVYIYPAITNTNKYLENYPAMVFFVNESNIIVFDNTTPLLFDTDDGFTRIIINGSVNKNIEILETNALTPQLTSDVWINTQALGNSMLTVNYTAENITSIMYKTQEFLASSTNLSTSIIRQRWSNITRSKVLFDGLNLSVDAYAPRIWMEMNASRNLTFKLRPFLTSFYIGGNEYSFDTTADINSLSNLTSLYNSTLGISFIGNNLNITVKNGTNERIVEIYDVNKLELFVHEGSYSLAENESAVFDKNLVKIVAPLVYEAVKNGSLAELAQQSYQEQRALFEIEDMNFKARIGNITIGMQEVPLTTNVYVRTLPLFVLYNNGTVSKENMIVWVWL